MTVHDEAEDGRRTTLPASEAATAGSIPTTTFAARGMRMPSITDASLKRVREATSLTELVRSHVELRPAGHGAVGCCPFHDDSTPSFNVYEARGTYYCFGCNAGGDAFRFLMETERMTFGEAARMLAERAGIPLEYSGSAASAGANAEERRELSHIMQLAAQFYARCLTQRPSAGGARAHLQERGVSPAACMSFQLGYSPSDDDSPVVDYLLQEGFALPTLVEAGLLSNASANSIQRRSESGSYVAGAGSDPAVAAGRRRNSARCVDRFRGRLVIPIRDHRGAVVAFGARDLGGSSSSTAPAAASLGGAATAAAPRPVAAADEGAKNQRLLLREARTKLAKASVAAARANAVQAAAKELAADLEAGGTVSSVSAVAAAAVAAAAAATAAVQADKAKEVALKEVEAAAAALAAAAAAGTAAGSPAAAAASAVTSTMASKDAAATEPKIHVAKYLNSPETPLFKKGRHVFGLDLANEAIREADLAIVVEGYFDVIALHEAGLRNAVGAMGTALTAEQLQLAARHARSRRVVLNLDGDEAGARAVARLCEGGAGSGRPSMLDTLAEAGVEVRVATLPPESGCKDPADFLQKHSAQEYRERVLDTAVPWTVWYGDRIISSAAADGVLGADADVAARRACVARITGFLSRISSAPERHVLAFRFAKMLAGGDDRLQIRLETDLVAEADAKARRQLSLLRRVSDVAGLDSDAMRMTTAAAAAAAAAAAGDSGGGGLAAAAAAAGASSQPLWDAQRKGQGSILGTLTSGRATLGDDVVDTAGGRGGGGGSGSSNRRVNGKGGSSGGGVQRRRDGDATERTSWRPTLFGPNGVGASAETGNKKKWGRREGGGRQDSFTFWEPIDYDADKLPQQQRQRWIAERQLLSLLLHDVKQRSEFLYVEEQPPPLPNLSTSQRQWLLEALAALPPDMRNATAIDLLEHFRGVAPPGCFAPLETLETDPAATTPDATAAGAAAIASGRSARRRTRSSNLEVLDGLFAEPVDAAASLGFPAPGAAAEAEAAEAMAATVAVVAASALASQEAELRLQQLLLVIYRAEATEELRRLFQELAEATQSANEPQLAPLPPQTSSLSQPRVLSPPPAVATDGGVAAAGSSIGVVKAGDSTVDGDSVHNLDVGCAAVIASSDAVNGGGADGVDAVAAAAAAAPTIDEAAAARLDSLRQQVRDKLDYLGGLKLREKHLESCMERLGQARAREKAAAAASDFAASGVGDNPLGAEAAALALAESAAAALMGDQDAYAGMKFLNDAEVTEADADAALFLRRLDERAEGLGGAAAAAAVTEFNGDDHINCYEDGGDFDWDLEDLPVEGKEHGGDQDQGDAFTAGDSRLWERQKHAIEGGLVSYDIGRGVVAGSGGSGGSGGDNNGGGGWSGNREQGGLQALPNYDSGGRGGFADDGGGGPPPNRALFYGMAKRSASGRMREMLHDRGEDGPPGDYDSLAFSE